MAKKILLADDSVTIQKVVELTLMDQDYEVVAVSDGDQALERLDSSNPDLVIADVHMPGPDGYEVCQRAKAGRSDLPVILLVGSFEPFDSQRMADCGAELHLKKPFDSQELLRTVEELLEGPVAAAAVPASVPAAEPQPEEVRSFMADEPAAAESAPPVPSLDLPAVAPAAPVLQPEPAAPRLEPAAAAAPAAEVPVPAPVPVSEPAPEAASTNGGGLSDEDVERVARKVIDSIGERVIREVAWDVIPDLAEIVIRERLRELEGQVE